MQNRDNYVTGTTKWIHCIMLWKYQGLSLLGNFDFLCYKANVLSVRPCMIKKYLLTLMWETMPLTLGDVELGGDMKKGVLFLSPVSFELCISN